MLRGILRSSLEPSHRLQSDDGTASVEFHLSRELQEAIRLLAVSRQELIDEIRKEIDSADRTSGPLLDTEMCVLVRPAHFERRGRG